MIPKEQRITMEHIFECVILIFFCICLYRVFCKRPKIKVVKAPTTKEIRRQRKKDRRMRKIKRKFKLPYHGKTEIIEYSKTKPYIESAWKEIEK